MRLIEDIICIILLLFFTDDLLEWTGLYDAMYQLIEERQEAENE